MKFEIWDTAGQDRFHALAPMYYRNSQAAIVVFDITKKASLQKARLWTEELNRQVTASYWDSFEMQRSSTDSGQPRHYHYSCGK